MPERKKQTAKLNWTRVKGELVDMERKVLLNLIRDLYKLGKDNQVFLHTRLGQGDDVLKPYKATIQRWICPDIFRNQDYSISKAQSEPPREFRRGFHLSQTTMAWLSLS